VSKAQSLARHSSSHLVGKDKASPYTPEVETTNIYDKIITNKKSHGKWDIHKYCKGQSRMTLNGPCGFVFYLFMKEAEYGFNN